MRWEPNDVIRLVALLGALALLGLGAYMMWQGIAAEGAIDIKSSLLSGSVKTGSAGLFIAFLAFCIVVFVLLSSAKRIAPLATAGGNDAKSRNIGRLLIALFIATVASGALAALGQGEGFGLLAMFLGFLLIPTGAVYFTFLEAE